MFKIGTNRPLAIGITGTNAAGKDTVAIFFKNKGFNVYSHSDELRNILKDKNIKITRDTLHVEGNRVRKKFGNDALSIIIFKKIKLPAVILSIRHPEEVLAYKNNLEKFILLSVDAPRKIRYERAVKRKREGEGRNESYEEFITKEEKEMKGDGEKQQAGKVINMADISVDNGGTLDDLNKKLELLYNDIVSV